MALAESSVLVSAVAIAAIAAAAAAVAPEVAHAVNVIDDQKLRLICVAGSLGGAVLSVGVFPPRHIRDMAFKLMCSGISGVLFSPVLLRWLGWSVDTDVVLATSGAVALLSWASLQVGVPKIVGILTGRIDKWGGPPT